MNKNKGRPTKYRSEMCTVLEVMMRQGASQIEVMAEIDISEDTFYRWKKEKEDRYKEDQIIKQKSLNSITKFDYRNKDIKDSIKPDSYIQLNTNESLLYFEIYDNLINDIYYDDQSQNIINYCVKFLLKINSEILLEEKNISIENSRLQDSIIRKTKAIN